jgi:hypothetical protein
MTGGSREAGAAIPGWLVDGLALIFRPTSSRENGKVRKACGFFDGPSSRISRLRTQSLRKLDKDKD